MASLKQFIHEIHRRSLWQVLVIYLGASWAVMEATNQVVEQYLLPEWVYPAALILLLIGFPIVLATAFVREDREPARVEEIRDPTLLGGGTAPPETTRPAVAKTVGSPLARLLSWRRAILGGVLAFTALGLVSAVIVLRGTARVTEAYGAAGEAFGERAWIVMADFDAPDSEVDVALAAQAALEVDLQQSAYVNLRGRNQLLPVLRRMGLPDSTSLNERLALDVAEREGFPAVLAPAVSRLGRDYVFSARVVQPGTGEELIAVRAVAREDRLVEAVETLSREVRRRLGEASDAIRRSKPLPEVTTRSLEALKVYAEGVRASLDLNHERALEAAEEAIRLDSTFAMAHRLLSLANWGLGRLSETAASATRAYELRDRLTDRERLHVEAFYHLNVDFDVRRAGEIYELLLSRYPDDFRATNNLGFVSSAWLGNYEQAYEAYGRAHELDPYSVIGYANVIGVARRLGKWEMADSLSAAAKGLGMAAEAARWDVQLAVARENWARADTLCDALLAEATSATETRQQQILCGGLAASRGRVRQAIDLLEPASLLYADRHRLLDLANLLVAFAIVEQTRGRPSAALSHLAAMLERYPADSISERDRYIVRMHLAVAAGTLGQTDLVDRIQATYPRDRDPPVWVARYGVAMEDAARALSAGAPARALEHLREVREFGYKPAGWQFDVNLLFGLTFEELGAVDSAVVYLERAINPGAFSGGGTWPLRMARTQLPLVLRRLAELEESRGNTDAAIRQYRRFLDLWSDPDPELRDQVDSARRALARLSGAESS